MPKHADPPVARPHLPVHHLPKGRHGDQSLPQELVEELVAPALADDRDDVSQGAEGIRDRDAELRGCERGIQEGPVNLEGKLRPVLLEG